MTPERSTADDPAGPNRATVAGLDAKVATALAKIEGLTTLVDERTGNIRDQISPLTGLPVTVATLQADLKALDARETESDTDIDRRVTELEQRNSRMSNQRWALIVAVVGSLVVDLASRIHIP